MKEGTSKNNSVNFAVSTSPRLITVPLAGSHHSGLLLLALLHCPSMNLSFAGALYTIHFLFQYFFFLSRAPELKLSEIESHGVKVEKTPLLRWGLAEN